MTRAVRGHVGASVLIREPAFRGLAVQRALALAILLLLLWPLLHRPVWRTRRWWRAARASGVPGAARWIAAVLRTTALVFAVCFGVGATALATDLGGGTPRTLLLATSLPFLIAPLSIAAAVACALLWRHRHGTPRERLGYTGLVLGGLGLVWWTDYWNVLLTRL